MASKGKESLFEASVEAQANSENVGYLGDPKVLQALLRNAVGEILDSFNSTDTPERKMGVLKRISIQTGKVLLGEDPNFVTVRHWNRPGAIDTFSAKWLGCGQGNPRETMEQCIVKLIKEVMVLAQYANVPGVLDEQWQWQYDAILERYVAIFMGISPVLTASSM